MSKLPTREEIQDKYKWNLKDIYATEEDWNNDYELVEQKVEELSKYKGKISTSSKDLLDFLNLKSEVGQVFGKLFIFARMQEDENTKDPKRQSLVQKLSPLQLKYSGGLSFFSTELLTIEKETMDEFYGEQEGLHFYKKYLDEYFRSKEHILSPEKEEVLSQTSLLYSASDTFNKIDNADITFEPIKDENGNELLLTNGTYSTYVKSEDREIRKQAFKNLYKSYDGLKNTIASTFLGNLKKDMFYSKIRGYESSLAAELFSDNIPVEVYDNLIKTVKENIQPMYDYVKLRKEILGVDELHVYDMYAPLVEDSDKKISYDEAYELMKKALSILGKEYESILDKARAERWIDVYETDGKRGGAYSWGPYGTHPYVLLNHKDDLNSAFTLVHEMGHLAHTKLSYDALPYIYAGYSIFVAEVASTVNEVLLMRYLLDNTTDKKMKMSLVNEFLEKFKSTLYRQTMFAEFEKVTHEKVEQGEPLTVKEFNEIYLNLNKQYYGEGLVQDDEISLEWARIPHFYNAFYVYQYATGFSAAIAIAYRILKEGQPAVDDYLKFLRSGGSDYPIELLKIAGIDMSSPQPIEDALKLFSELVIELKNLYNE